MRHAIAVILALMTSATPVAADKGALLAPYTATYEVSRGVMRGETEVVLSNDGDGNWTYRSHLRSTGLVALLRSIEIVETTVFRVEHGRVVPLHHAYSIDGAGRRDRDFVLDFDWVKRRLTGIVAGEQVESDLDPGIVDRHAMPIAVMLDLQHGSPFPRPYVLMDRGRIRHLEGRVEGEATLRTGAGEFLTLEVIQQRQDDPTRRYHTWLAPGLGYLPVRISSVDDEGTDISLTLTRFSR